MAAILNWVKESKTYEKEVKGITGLIPIRLSKDGTHAIVWVKPSKVEERIIHYQEKGFNPIKQLQK